MTESWRDFNTLISEESTMFLNARASDRENWLDSDSVYDGYGGKKPDNLYETNKHLVPVPNKKLNNLNKYIFHKISKMSTQDIFSNYGYILEDFPIIGFLGILQHIKNIPIESITPYFKEDTLKALLERYQRGTTQKSGNIIDTDLKKKMDELQKKYDSAHAPYPQRPRAQAVTARRIQKPISYGTSTQKADKPSKPQRPKKSKHILM